MKTLRDVFEERLWEFQKEYEWNEQDDVVRALSATGQMLDLLFIGREASLAMTALRELISWGTRPGWKWVALDNVEADADWRTTWESIEGWRDTSTPPFLDELRELAAFANFGIIPVWQFSGSEDLQLDAASHLKARLMAVGNPPEWIESICLKIDAFEQLAPRNEDGSARLRNVLQTRDLARVRLKFDADMALSVQELAHLSGVSMKRLQNAIYAKADDAPVVDKNGLIGPESCAPWLMGRDYHFSIWKQVMGLYPLEKDWGADVPYDIVGKSEQAEEFVFVPIANDGTIFSPSLRRDSKDGQYGYMIGPKGAERKVESYREALNLLATMPTPRWRRPNPENSNWGIVTGQSWKRMRMTELEARDDG